MSDKGNSGDTPEGLRYALLGEDAGGTGEKLEKYTGEVDWSYIKPHFESGALLYVDPSLVITEVGRAIGVDNKAKIEAWLKSGDLIKPGQPHAEHWENSSARFTALVVSPFVLIQSCEPA
jgi:hypothetical protein